MSEKYKSLKVKELQELLTKNGLPQAGKKEELIERLVKHDKELASLDDEFADLDEFDEYKINLDDISESAKPIGDLTTEIEEIADDDEVLEPITTTTEAQQPEDATTTTTTTTTPPAKKAPVVISDPIVKPNSNFKFTPVTFDKEPSTTSTPALTKKASPAPAPTAVAAAAASPSKPINAASDAKVKSIDDAEKALERAKRFGIQLNEKAKQDIRAQRFGIANKAAVPATAPSTAAKKTGIDPEVLKKRAERFGISQAAATVATAKGTVPVKFDAAEEEKKRKRAERFNAESATKKQKAE